LKCILFICAIRIQKIELLLLLEDKRGKIRVEITCHANDPHIIEQPSIMMIKSVYYHTNFMVYSRRQVNAN
jgi:hypothetical protein